MTKTSDACIFVPFQKNSPRVKYVNYFFSQLSFFNDNSNILIEIILQQIVLVFIDNR